MGSKAEWLGWVSAVLLSVCASSLPAQTAGSQLSYAAAGLPETADAAIEEMAALAGVIFAGQVTAVRGPVGSAGSGIVEVDFRVDEAVKGPAAGSIYTLREWAGLWNAAAGHGRYRAGQRLLIFLYAPDANGLSSPVRGLDGAVPLRGGGLAPGPDDTTATAAEWMVDLRWIEAQTLRGRAILLPGPKGPTKIFPGPVSPRPVFPGPISAMVTDGDAARTAMEQAPSMVRLPVGTPQPVAPVEAQPLAFVIGLCQEAMSRQARGEQATRRTDAGR
jgi:hypothetical protein